MQRSITQVLRSNSTQRAAVLALCSALAASTGCADIDVDADVDLPLSLSGERAFPGEHGVERRATLTIGGQAESVTLEHVHNHLVLEGDILIGELPEGSRDEVTDTAVDEVAARSSRTALWPNGRVPYVIAGDLPSPQRVRDAIAHWHDRTGIRLVQRTTERDYVAFVVGSGCSSYVGRIGGRQAINLASGCLVGQVIHEIGHAIGLYHEQSRSDRDRFVRINTANIKSGAAGNFQTYRQSNRDGQDIGSYDLGSIMHYGSYFFSRNGRPTIVTLSGGIIDANRNRLSASDVAGVARLYAR